MTSCLALIMLHDASGVSLPLRLQSLKELKPRSGMHLLVIVGGWNGMGANPHAFTAIDPP